MWLMAQQSVGISSSPATTKRAAKERLHSAPVLIAPAIRPHVRELFEDLLTENFSADGKLVITRLLNGELANLVRDSHVPGVEGS